ncbi:unnamed protein product, partial [Mesorhabditis spiculigera]
MIEGQLEIFDFPALMLVGEKMQMFAGLPQHTLLAQIANGGAHQ